MFVLDDTSVFKEMKTNNGPTVSELSQKSPVMLIFLRHLGCVFCKEALSDLKKVKDEIIESGVRIVFVHMAPNEIADSIFTKFGIGDVHHISDSESVFYEAFGLDKGNFKQLFGFTSWLGIGRAAVKGNFPGKVIFGDPSQMPGVFMVKKDEIVKTFIYKSVGDHPDYIKISKF